MNPPDAMVDLDGFAVLGLPRAAALDEGALQRAYAVRCREAHPDHGGSEGAAARVNAAYETLRHADRRLKHLLELAGPAAEEARAWRTVPLDEGMMGLFAELGRALEGSGRFLERRDRAGSALARALLAGEAMGHRAALEGLAAEIERRRGGCARQEGERNGTVGWMRHGTGAEWNPADTPETGKSSGECFV